MIIYNLNNIGDLYLRPLFLKNQPVWVDQINGKLIFTVSL